MSGHRNFNELRRNLELRKALVPDGLLEMYQTSASFHYSVDSLAAMLPAMVLGLAEGARKADLACEAAIRTACESVAGGVLDLTPPGGDG